MLERKRARQNRVRVRTRSPFQIVTERTRWYRTARSSDVNPVQKKDCGPRVHLHDKASVTPMLRSAFARRDRFINFTES